MKIQTISNEVLSNFVAADAGNAAAQHGARLSALFGALLNVYKDGNKHQLMLVQSAAELHDTPEKCLELVGAAKVNAAARRASKVYGAYAYGIKQLGTVGKLKVDGKWATVEQCQERAEEGAIMIADLVTAAVMPKAPKVRTEEEVRAAEQKKKNAEKEAAKELKEKIAAAANAKVHVMASKGELPIDAAVQAVAAALATNTLTDEMSEMLAQAFAARALLLASVSTPEEVPA